MKILYFLAHPDGIGGAMKVLLTQAYIMHERRHEIKVIIQNNKKNEHIQEYDILCKKMNINFSSAQYPIATCIENIDICEVIESYERIKNMVVEFMPDILHSVQLNNTVELVAREMGIPHIMNIYQISDGMFNINWIDIFPKYHCCDSLFYSRKWVDGLDIESRCIRVAYMIPDTVHVFPSKNNDRLELINIANFGEHKNQMEIIKFIEECKKKGYHVHINLLGYNETVYGEKCRKYVAESNLENEVTFVGQVLNVEDYLSQAELMVHASTAESYPGVIVEAMANKVIVMATSVAGVPELLIDQENGFLTEGFTFHDLYNCFKKFLQFKNNGKTNMIKEKAYHTYLENHTYDIVGNKLEAYYSHILKDSSDIKGDRLSMNDIIKICKSFDFDKSNTVISDYTKSKKWFLFFIDKVIKENNYKTAYIWGAGMFGKIALEWCRITQLDILGFVDSFKSGLYEGYPIYQKKDCDLNSADVIFVAIGSIRACEEVTCILERKGRSRNKNYFLLSNDPCMVI